MNESISSGKRSQRYIPLILFKSILQIMFTTVTLLTICSFHIFLLFFSDIKNIKISSVYIYAYCAPEISIHCKYTIRFSPKGVVTVISHVTSTFIFIRLSFILLHFQLLLFRYIMSLTRCTISLKDHSRHKILFACLRVTVRTLLISRVSSLQNFILFVHDVRLSVQISSFYNNRNHPCYRFWQFS